MNDKKKNPEYRHDILQVFCYKISIRPSVVFILLKL